MRVSNCGWSALWFYNRKEPMQRPAQNPQAIREELQRILTSPGFLHSDRLRRFLTHCVDAALDGRVELLKEYSIGVAAFDRPTHYNPAEDPIVRVEARRLRRKLGEYYQTQGAADPIVIELPKGGYLPRFEFRAAPAPRSRVSARAAAGIAAIALCGVAAALWWMLHPGPALPELTLTRVTFDHGLTTDPALSADGGQLVYASDRAGNGNLDIWIQPLTANAAPRRLTDDPADDSQPAVSPDGATVVFRSERQPPGLYAVRASGGSATLLAVDGRNPRYSPDARWIAYWAGAPGGGALPPAGKLYVMPSSGGAPRRILANFISTACPAWSPDSGRLLVEARQDAADTLDLWTVALNEEHAATGIARLLDRAHLKFALRECSFSWGREAIIFSGAEGDTQSLWRVPVTREGRPAGAMVRSTLGSAEEVLPFEAASGAIAFASRTENLDIWRLRVEAPGELTRVTEGIGSPVFPHALGNRLTFLSNSGGRSAVWLKDLATGRAAQLTRPPAAPRYPQLCPDGETVLFSEGPNTFAVTPTSPAPRLLCNGCSRVWQCAGRELLYVPAGAGSPVEIDAFNMDSGAKTRAVVSPHDLANVQKSADGWLAFHAITGVAQRQIFAARWTPGKTVAPEEWIPITDGSQLDRNAVWNARYDTLYFLSERCGFRCIWSQRLDRATKKPVGPPVAVRHFHSAARGLSSIGDVGAIGLSYDAGYLYFTLADQAGDVWLARPVR